MIFDVELWASIVGLVPVELRMLLLQKYHATATAIRSSILYWGPPILKAITAVTAATPTNITLLSVRNLVITIGTKYASAIRISSDCMNCPKTMFIASFTVESSNPKHTMLRHMDSALVIPFDLSAITMPRYVNRANIGP